jgi:hypothetical protein
VSNADVRIDVSPKINPKDEPKTRALKMRTNHIGSIPTAPAPRGRSAATIAVSTPRSAIDFASKESLLISIMTNAIAKADAAQKKIDATGIDVVFMRKGQMKPNALIAEVSESTNKVRGRKRTSAEVFID